MKRSIGQVLFRYLPGALTYDDDAEVLGRVTNVEGAQDQLVDRGRLARAISRQLASWRDIGHGTLRGIDAPIEPQRLTPIRPSVVYWTPYPKEVACPRCHRVANIDDRTYGGRCPECQLSSRQLPYVYIHHCGALNYLRPIAQVRCPRHGRRSLSLFDTGRFTTSLWRCAECSFERGLGIVACGAGCETPQSLRQAGLTDNLQGAVWNDPWVYFPQTAKFVNLDEDRANAFVATAEGADLLRRGAAGQVPAGNHALFAMLQGAAPKCPTCAAPLPSEAKFCAQCGTPVATPPDVTPGDPLDPASDCATFALLRDLPQSRSLAWDARLHHDLRGEYASAALGQLGIADVVYVANFPVTTGAFGFSRLLSQPPATLRGYPSETDATTVYTDSRTTEAWLIQLNPESVRDWLAENKVPATNDSVPPVDPLDLIRAVSENESYLTLLHSTSHAAMMTLSQLAGLEDASLEEILMPEIACFAIYSSSDELGALGAVFEQSIMAFADELPRGLDSCRFDPVCREHETSACVGCLYLVRGCERYNGQLSRAALVTNPGGQFVGYWSRRR